MAKSQVSSILLAFARFILYIFVCKGLFISGIETTLLGNPNNVPGFFIFGDSLFDNGNNNNLQTKAKANYHPYGIDFPGGPTGRFTNGRTIVDILGELLGFENYIPPFTTVKDQEIIKGVNYASGAAGIRDETGKQLGDRIPLNKQLENHQTIISRLNKLLGNQTVTNEHLRKCLYVVGMGSNDYINNYFTPQFFETSKLYTPDQYAQILIQQYHQQLTTIYKLGARKVVVFGLGPIGCTPSFIEKYGRNGIGCVDSINNAVQLFNDRLKSLMDDLNSNLPYAKFTYINIFSIQSVAPAAHGLRILNKACCIDSTTGGHCIPDLPPCPLRILNVFWDKLHPSEVANLFTANRAYHSLLPSDAYPIDIYHLAMQ